MAGSRKLTVEFVGDTASLERAFGRARKGADQTGSKFGTLGKNAGRVGAAIGVGLAGAAKVGFTELAEGQKVTAQTAAVLKSTGGAANVTSKHVEKLAGSISRKTGIDDEAIQSSENLLLTFTNVRNETGRGNKIFDRATKTVQDMSVALGQDGKSSAIQLGKALNDPIKGITALQRVGVTFTEGQKKQIAAMVESGNTLGAQKVILKELNKEFGGSAVAAGKTLPGQLNKLKNAFAEVSAGVVSALLPALLAMSGVMAKVGRFFQKNPKAAKVFAAAVAALAAVLVTVSVTTKVATAATKLWAAATKGAAAAQWLLNIALHANPIGLVVIGLVALGAGLVLAYKKSEKFRNIVNGVWRDIKSVAGSVIRWLTNAVKDVVKWIENRWQDLKAATGILWSGVRDKIITPLKGAINWVRDAVTNVKGWISDRWSDIRNRASQGWTNIKNAVISPFRDTWEWVRNAVRNARDWLSDRWQGLVEMFGKYKEPILRVLTLPFRLAVTAIGKMIGLILKVVDAIPGVDLSKQRADVSAFVEAHGLARGGAFRRTRGVVNQPITLMGEEAPRHPEYVIPTNPAYRKRARGLLAQAAGAIGFAGGGVFGSQALADLWVRAGGPSGIAPLMARIALAESGGNPNAFNPSGATGLWQILGALVPGNLRNPFVNALNAVAKYRLQGLHAWDASRSVWGKPGAVGGGGGGIGALLSGLLGKLPGVGDLPDWIKGLGTWALNKVKDWMTGFMSGIVGGGAGIGGQTTGTWKMARTIASKFGLGISSSWRSVAHNRAVGGVEGSLHTHGSMSNPGAFDFTGSIAAMNAALTWVRQNLNLKESLIHDAGSGLHLHLGFFKKGGVFGDSPYLGSYQSGGVLPDDGLYYGHKGETVTPAGGPLVNIEHMTIRQETDIERVSRRLGWLVAGA